jgi:hypothetical protein
MTAMMTSCSNEKNAPEAQIGVNAGPAGKPAPFKEPVIQAFARFSTVSAA